MLERKIAMKKGERTVSDTLDVKGKEIGPILRWYLADEIWVNRKYQRKLVWSLKEKQLFIDSIINKFPTPSMMLCSYDKDGKHYYEIIDGLQRINAIISFALMEFPVTYEGKACYFDISESDPVMHAARDMGLDQREPKLPRKVCEGFLSYELPLILTEQDDEKIEKIFLRINSSGKKLSAHDLRQSSSCDSFAELVRRVSCYARGEYSFEDLLLLRDMPKISVGGDGLNYGIDVRKTFWRRHNVITIENIKQSRDEELIARVIAELLLSDITNPSSDMLNKMYQTGNDYNTRLNSLIEDKGMLNLEEEMRNTFDIIEGIFHSVDSNFSTWLFENPHVGGRNDCFRIFYISLHKILREGYTIRDYRDFAEKIYQLADKTMHKIVGGRNVTVKLWKDSLLATYRFIKPLFVLSQKHVPTKEEKQIERRLCRSSVESQMTEYKAGLSEFGTGKRNSRTFYRIAKALSAMANTKSKEPGWVILGVADTMEDGRDWEREYGADALICGNHYITGVEHEANKYFGGLDGYLKYIGDQMSKQALDDTLIEYVLANYKEVDFYDKKLVILPSKRMNHEVLFDKAVYTRVGNESKKKR